jgi:hypothetical protein
MVEGSFKAGKTQSDENAEAQPGVPSPYFA